MIDMAVAISTPTGIEVANVQYYGWALEEPRRT
jgi:hypothetical protein